MIYLLSLAATILELFACLFIDYYYPIKDSHMWLLIASLAITCSVTGILFVDLFFKE